MNEVTAGFAIQRAYKTIDVADTCIVLDAFSV